MLQSAADPSGPQNTDAAPQASRRFPPWLKKRVSFGPAYSAVHSCISGSGLHTVCVEAKCPNRAECFSSGTATFLIMGPICTRHCGFCGVAHGAAQPLDPDEPLKVARAAQSLNLRHIVITSVTRDDLPDGGASHFAETVRVCRNLMPDSTIEILIPDFDGNPDAFALILTSHPDILNHNLETVPRLYPAIRPRAGFIRSLELLMFFSKRDCTTKSGIMVGFGESEEEVITVLRQLRSAGCRIVTIGQYLRPSAEQVPVAEYVPPERFRRYEEKGIHIGFESVAAGPFIRSSYHAHEYMARKSGSAGRDKEMVP